MINRDDESQWKRGELIDELLTYTGLCYGILDGVPVSGRNLGGICRREGHGPLLSWAYRRAGGVLPCIEMSEIQRLQNKED